MRIVTALSLAVLLFGGSVSVADATTVSPPARHHHHRVHHHERKVTWTHWGAAPFAHSFAEACAKTPWAMDHSTMPQEVKAHFKQVIGSKCEGGRDAYLVPSQHLNQMASASPTGDFMMNDVTVAKLPVARAPDGRVYRVNAVFETARVKVWRYEYNGVVYVWFIPYVCYNDGWFTEAPPPDTCVKLAFSVPDPSQYPSPNWRIIRWGIGSTDGPLPPSVCNAQREGLVGPFVAWYGQCDVCVETVTFLAHLFGVPEERVTIPHKYRYAFTQSAQTLRFSTAVWKKIVYICVLYPDGSTRTVFIRPEDWHGKHYLAIDNHYWLDQAGEFPPKPIQHPQ